MRALGTHHQPCAGKGSGPGQSLLQPANDCRFAIRQEDHRNLSFTSTAIHAKRLVECVASVIRKRNLHLRLVTGTRPPGNHHAISICVHGWPVVRTGIDNPIVCVNYVRFRPVITLQTSDVDVPHRGPARVHLRRLCSGCLLAPAVDHQRAAVGHSSTRRATLTGYGIDKESSRYLSVNIQRRVSQANRAHLRAIHLRFPLPRCDPPLRLLLSVEPNQTESFVTGKR